MTRKSVKGTLSAIFAWWCLLFLVICFSDIVSAQELDKKNFHQPILIPDGSFEDNIQPAVYKLLIVVDNATNSECYYEKSRGVWTPTKPEKKENEQAQEKDRKEPNGYKNAH